MALRAFHNYAADTFLVTVKTQASHIQLRDGVNNFNIEEATGQGSELATV